MTVKLLVDRPIDGKEYKAGNLCDTDDNTEAGLISAKLAIADLAGGTAYVAPVIQPQIIPVTATTNLTGGIEFSWGDKFTILQGRIPDDVEMLFMRPIGARRSFSVPSPYAEIANPYVIHPSIVYIPYGWNGYCYWMAYTPLNGNNSQYENPSICASNDLQNWVVPDGCPNPVFPPPGGSTYNRDPHLYFYNNQLILLFSTRNESGKNRLKISTSANGSSWTPYAVIWDGVLGTSDIASPSIWFDPSVNKWIIVGHNVDSAGREFRKITSDNILSGWDTSPTTLTFPSPAGRKWWHSWFTRLASGRIVGIVQDNPGDTTSGNLYVAESMDGSVYSSGRLMAENRTLYRSSLFFVEKYGKVDVTAIYSDIYCKTFFAQSLSTSFAENVVNESQRVATIISAAKTGPDRTILAADDFTRADSATSLGATLDGKTWTQYLTHYMGISGNAAYNSDSGNCRSTIDFGSTSYSVSVIFAQTVVGASGYLIANMLDDTHFWRIGYNTASKIMGCQRINGSIDIDMTFASETIESGDIVRVDVSGQNLKFYKNGDLLYTANGTGFATTMGVCGIQASGSSVNKFRSFVVQSIIG